MKAGYDDFFRKARVNAGVTTKESSQAKFALKNDEPAAQRRSEARGESAVSRQGRSSQTVNQDRVQQLREKVKQKRQSRRRRFPWKLVMGSTFGFLLTGAGLQYHEQIDQFLGRIEIGATTTALAAEPAKAATAPSGERTPGSVDPKASDKVVENGKPASEWSETEVNHLQKLVQRKEQLDAREAELGRLESELTAQREELEKKLKSMDETRTGISNMLQERSTQDAEKVETLVQVYSNMKPSNAAKVLETLDEDLAVEIIGRMKKKNAAEVLNLMKPEKAQSFSEKFAGYRKK